MHTTLAPLLSAVLALAAPPPAPQAALVRSPGDATVSEIGGKNFKQWLDDLKHTDASTREEAIRALVLFGHDAPKAVPELVKRLRDPDSSPRVRAAIALSMIDIRKEDLPSVVQALGERLSEDPQAIVRYYAATTLHNFGEDARGALAGLNKGVVDRATWEIRHACIVVLKAAGHDAKGAPIPSAENALIEALHDPTYQVRLEAIMTIGALGRPDEPTMLQRVRMGLRDRLVDRDPTVKIWAYAALMALDETIDNKHLQAVIKFLTHNEMKVKVQAARALGTLGNRAKAAVPALVEALRDKEVPVVSMAGWALAQMDGLSGSSKEALLGLLKNQEPGVRAAGAQAFGIAGIKGRPAVVSLAELVQDKEQPPFVVASGCWALGEIGEPNAQAIAALNSIIDRKDVDESLKQFAQTALEQIRKLKK